MAFGIRWGRTILVMAALLCAPLAARAAGFDVPDNGASVIARGGTSTNLLGTAYGLQFNPAGMTQINGLDVRLDVRAVDHRVGFTRAPTDELQFRRVENSARPFVAPMVSLAYRHPGDGLLSRFAFGLGAWGPPGVGRYRFADPLAVEDPAEEAGQRYSLVESDIMIYLPTVGAAYRVTDTLSVGLAVSAVWADVRFGQALSAQIEGGEDPNFDAQIGLDVTTRLTPTVMLGGVWQFAPGWTFATSFRPKITLQGDGELDVRIPQSLESMVEVDGDTTRLTLKMPAVLRAGVGFARGRFSGAAEFVYEGWSAMDEILLEPDVSFKLGGETTSMEEFRIPKNWVDSYGARLGASYRVLDEEGNRPSIELHTGALFESNAIPSEYQSVDFVTGTRYGGSLGVTVGYKGFGLTVSGLGFLPQDFRVTDSKVEQAAAIEGNEKIIVGNGRYTSSVLVGAISLSYNGLGRAPQAPLAR